MRASRLNEEAIRVGHRTQQGNQPFFPNSRQLEGLDFQVVLLARSIDCFVGLPYYHEPQIIDALLTTIELDLRLDIA